MPEPISNSPDASTPWIVRAPGIILAFLWGFAEGTFFFVVPDVAISLAALLAPRRAWRHALAAIAGAVIAGALLYTWSTHNPPAAANAVAHVPFVTAKMFTHVHTGYKTRGATAVLLGPLSGVPYKIYAVEAPAFLTRTTFLLATIPGRGERFLLVWLFFGTIGFLAKKYRRPTTKHLAIVHGIFWTLFYAFYWTTITLRSR
jgi:membrane protein YqaA with SNARE-associated domain